MRFIFSLLAIIIGVTSCTNNQAADDEVVIYRKSIKTGTAQGTYYAITYYDSLDRDFGADIDQVLKDFDQSCSNYQPESVISKVNRNEDVVLDDLFIGNFELAQQVAQETQGDFDITVRPLVELWGFGIQNQREVIQSDVENVLSYIGYDKIRIVDGKIEKNDPRIMLDFNAVAQGYSVDVMTQFFDSKGVKYFLVDIGGELYARNAKPDGTHWKVGVEQPADSAQYGENLSAVISLENCGMATSGNYRKYYIRDGVKYAHTISPHTGYPVQHTLLSATVVAPNAALADAYATAFMVMGIVKAKLLLATHPNLDAYLIYSDSLGQFKTFSTPALKAVLKEN